MKPFRGLALPSVAGLALLFGANPAGLNAQESAVATLGDSGIVVRFPRSVSPDSVTREMVVGDRFSGYEWRVILVIGERALLTAFVIAPDDGLALHHYDTVKDAYLAGDLRRCDRAENEAVLLCSRPARGLVRDAAGRIEIGIIDAQWLTSALALKSPKLKLVVRRGREEVWSQEIPILQSVADTGR